MMWRMSCISEIKTLALGSGTTKGSGICGIAVISAIFAAEDIRTATAQLKVLTEKMVQP